MLMCGTIVPRRATSEYNSANEHFYPNEHSPEQKRKTNDDQHRDLHGNNLNGVPVAPGGSKGGPRVVNHGDTNPPRHGLKSQNGKGSQPKHGGKSSSTGTDGTGTKPKSNINPKHPPYLTGRRALVGR